MSSEYTHFLDHWLGHYAPPSRAEILALCEKMGYKYVYEKISHHLLRALDRWDFTPRGNTCLIEADMKEMTEAKRCIEVWKDLERYVLDLCAKEDFALLVDIVKWNIGKSEWK